MDYQNDIDNDIDGEFDPGALLRYYGALERASRDMLAAARAGDWDQVCRLEGACSVVVSRLRCLPLAQALEGADRAERMRMLRVILANDAEIRRICEPQPAVLEELVFACSQPSALLH